MNEPFEEFYFNWLCAKVERMRPTTPSNSYFRLLKILQNTEFVWLLSGDDNRAADGQELRREFLIAAELPDNKEWRFHEGCSIFEMLIAFSRRAEFQTAILARDWFWEFLDNLGLSDFNDAFDVSDDIIDDILYQLVWRTYEYDGLGGLFPIGTPKHDQRNVEIWYQFCDYLVDQDRLP